MRVRAVQTTLVSALVLVSGACDGGGTGEADEPGDLPWGEAGSDLGLDPDEGTSSEPVLLTIDEAMAAVDPFIGTGGLGFGYAALTPAVQTPFGMVRLGPDTTNGGLHPDVTHFSGYRYDDPDVRGFSHTHFVGTGVADFGNLRVLPRRALGEGEPSAQFTTLDKASEVAEPGYYSVDLPNEAVRVELTTSTHAGVHHYSFRGSDDAWILFDTAASVRDEGVVASRTRVTPSTIEGWVEYDAGYSGRTHSFTLYFDVTVDPPAAAVSVWDDSGYLTEATEAESASTGGVLWYETGEPSGDLTVTLRVGLSYVDADQARLNREDQVAGLTFEEVREANRALWEEKLSLVRLGDVDPTVARIFYTALYNTYRMPTRLDGVDGRYRGLDAEVHTADGFDYVSDLSLWDTFRTLHPWLVLTDPEAQTNCLRSLMAMRADGGYFPVWPAALSYTNGMIGDSADFLFAGSALKGIEGIDYETAFEGLLETATGPTAEGHPFHGRSGIEDYIALGYLPYEEHSDSVSVTLEYAWADWALANLADFLGRDEAAALRERSRSYSNLFHAGTGFFLPRDRAGEFDTSMRFTAGGDDFTEGTAWHWRFYVLHDPAGLADLMGGADKLGTELETFFSESALGDEGPIDTFLPDPYYWHGNEPTIHVPLLFWEAGRYDRVAYWVREIQTRLYGDGPDGLPGNDDGGTLSAWYLFNAIGLYPVAGSDLYLLSSPLVPYAEVRVGDADTLTIRAPGASDENRYVRSVSIDGEPLQVGYLRHADLLGATLTFEMADSI